MEPTGRRCVRVLPWSAKSGFSAGTPRSWDSDRTGGVKRRPVAAAHDRGAAVLADAPDNDPSGIASSSQAGAQFDLISVDPTMGLFGSAVLNGLDAMPLTAA